MLHIDYIFLGRDTDAAFISNSYSYSSSFSCCCLSCNHAP